MLSRSTWCSSVNLTTLDYNSPFFRFVSSSFPSSRKTSLQIQPMSTPIDYYDFRTYLPILPVLVILYRIFYKRCAGTPEQRFSCCRKSKAPVLVKLPNGMQVHSHQKGETDFLYKEVWEQREYAHKNFTCYDQKNPIIFDVGANM